MAKFFSPLLHQLFFFLLIIGILSCTSPDYPSSIDLTKNQDVSVFDVFSEVKVIALETSDNYLINDITRIVYHNKRYYILDQRSQQIFCFDENGGFVYKIDSQGRGQGEYHHITDFSIDENNQQMVVLDPALQRVHFFDLAGNFLSSRNVHSDKVLGLNRVYPLSDSILLFISVTNENLLFYSLKEEKIVYADYAYDVPSTLHVFSPKNNVFFYENKVLFLEPLSREIVDVSAMNPESYFTWCFGPNNNSAQQLNRIIEEINLKQKEHSSFLLPFQAVGKNKILNHHIMTTFENDRFQIAAIEYDDNFKFVIIDKKDKHTFVFDSFNEGILFPFEYIQADRSIIFYIPEFTSDEIKRIKSADIQEYFLERNLRLYCSEVFNEDCRKVIENHDPMTDNPFLVVYKFKE